MKTAGTYKITRQGQITLPAEARERLNLEEGDIVDLYYDSDIVLIKKKKAPLKVFEELSTIASKRFREKNITKEDIGKEIEAVRKGR